MRHFISFSLSYAHDTHMKRLQRIAKIAIVGSAFHDDGDRPFLLTPAFRDAPGD